MTTNQRQKSTTFTNPFVGAPPPLPTTSSNDDDDDDEAAGGHNKPNLKHMQERIRELREMFRLSRWWMTEAEEEHDDDDANANTNNHGSAAG